MFLLGGRSRSSERRGMSSANAEKQHFPEAQVHLFRWIEGSTALETCARRVITPGAGIPGSSQAKLDGYTVTLIPEIDPPVVSPLALGTGMALGATCCQVCCIAANACCAADRLPDCKACPS